MDEKRVRELKRDYINQIESLKREQIAFAKRVSVIMNLLLPGLGFLIFGKGFLKGLISSTIFYGYLYLFVKYINPLTDIGYLYFMPIIVIWIISAILVGSLENNE